MRKKAVVIVCSALLTAGMVSPFLPGNRTWEEVGQVWAATTIPGQWIQAADGRWWYQHSDGTYTKNDWEFINNRWYFFDESGWMVSGWRKISGKWYYLNPKGDSTYAEGQMLTGWIEDGGRWYYLNTVSGQFTLGEMLVNWQRINGKWYYLSPVATGTWMEGQRVSGWLTIGNNTYYLEKDGVMQTGVLVKEGKRYIFADSGELLSQEEVQEPEGKDKIVKKALESMEVPFEWGGKDLTKGCDNAGFLYGVLSACGYQIPEELSLQMKEGTETEKKDIAPGDLVFYKNGTITGAIYLEENQVIYAASPRWGVRITTLDHPGEILTIRRME